MSASNTVENRENRAPSTPSRNREDLVAQLDPNGSPQTLYRVGRVLQLRTNTLETEIAQLKRKLGDEENGDDDPESRSRRRRRRSDSDPDPDGGSHDTDSGAEDDHADTAEVMRLGRKCAIQGTMWFSVTFPQIFQVELSEDYVERERWENDANRVEGQARMLRELIPAKFHGEMWAQTWFWKAFKEGVTSQLSNTSTRLRNTAALNLIFGSEAAENIRAGEAKRYEVFREDIGWKEGEGDRGPYYATFDVPILHSNFSSKFDTKTAFLNPCLLQIFATLLRGPNAARNLMSGTWAMPNTEVMQTTVGIHHTTPGAIAGCCVLLRWVLSNDKALQPRGASSGINYKLDYDKYLKKILQALRAKKRWVHALFREWDRIVFRNDNSEFGGSKAEGTERLREEEENRVMNDDNESEDEGGSGDSQSHSGGDDDGVGDENSENNETGQDNDSGANGHDDAQDGN